MIIGYDIAVLVDDKTRTKASLLKIPFLVLVKKTIKKILPILTFWGTIGPGASAKAVLVSQKGQKWQK